MTRPNCEALDNILGQEFKILDHGFLRVIDYMGDDSSIVQAARCSYGTGTKSVSEDEALIRYLIRNQHTSPLEMCEIKFHVKMPIFVARQWIRHRTANLNEYSGRYSIMDKEFYIPDASHMARQSNSNKQGRGELLSEEESRYVQNLLIDDANRVHENYNKLIDEADLARELARINLGLNTYTQMYWKIDLHNLLHFLRLRCDSHAQYEIRVYAEKMLEIVKLWCPAVYRAFMDYKVNAVTYSALEQKHLMNLLNLGVEQTLLDLEADEKMSKAEKNDFKLKVGITEDILKQKRDNFNLKLGID